MIEFLILYIIHKNISTMYGIYHSISVQYPMFLLPSYGTIKPALKRLEENNCIKTQKTMSKGGRPSVYYSITKDGEQYLIELLTEVPKENPVQFLTTARLKILCSDILNKEQQFKLYDLQKRKAENILIDIQGIIKTKEVNSTQKIIYDNMLCEYNNFISLTKGLMDASNY